MTELQAQMLGTLVRQAREQKNITQEALARSTDIDTRWLRRLEQGEMAKPDANRLLRLAEQLELEPTSIDAMTDDLLYHEAPTTRMNFRAKHRLVITPEQEQELVALAAQMHQENRWKHKPSTGN